MHAQIHHVIKRPHFIAMSFEEIHISTIPADLLEEESPRSPRVIRAALAQHDRLRFCRRTFRLFDQRILSVQADGIFRRLPPYEFHIGILDPEPKRLVGINWRYLVAFLVLAATATLTATAGLFRDPILLSSVLAAAAALCLLMAVYSYHDRLIFYSQNGNVPLVILSHRKPDADSFDTFTAALIRNIVDVRDSFANGSELLREELKEHRRLREQGIITDMRYEGIRQHILGLHNSDPASHGHRSRLLSADRAVRRN